MRRIQFYTALFLPLLLLVGAVLPSPVAAEIEVIVSDNGAGTQNTVTVSQSNETQITQENTAQVELNVDQNANSGGNVTEGNTTENTTTTTGDVAETTEVATTVNTSTVVANTCCVGEQTVTVANNGAGSTNTVDAQVTNNASVSINQTATVTNNITVSGNTGNNTANNNTGSVTIDTGSITSVIKLNTILNLVSEDISLPGGEGFFLKIANNNANSTNTITSNLLNSFVLTKNNVAEIDNNVYAEFNTGGNSALNNLNDVLIKTGDVTSFISIDNGPINLSTTHVNLCCEDGESAPPETPPNKPPESAPPPTTPTQPGPDNKSSDTSPTGGGSSIAAVLAAMLPITGIPSAVSTWLWAVIYLIMFLSGLYVRLRAGRSPTKRYARAYAH